MFSILHSKKMTYLFQNIGKSRKDSTATGLCIKSFTYRLGLYKILYKVLVLDLMVSLLHI